MTKLIAADSTDQAELDKLSRWSRRVEVMEYFTACMILHRHFRVDKCRAFGMDSTKCRSVLDYMIQDRIDELVSI